MSVNTSFVEFLNKKYPNLPLSEISDRLVCASPIPLKAKVFEQIESEIAAFAELKAWTARQKKHIYEKRKLLIPNNFGVCNSFDFHVDANDEIHLIEINTNAAFLALGMNLYQFFDQKNFSGFNEAALVDMFRQEMTLAGASNDCIYIIDEAPQEQKLYYEFLLYKEIFKKHGLDCVIVDTQDNEAIKKIPRGSLVYNRYTDFYLSDPKSRVLRERFNNGEIYLSPQPWEYFQLADKERFMDWTGQIEVPHPKSLLKTFDLDIDPPEKIWPLRKSLFFKPKSSFGSKGVFKGASVSKKTFDGFFGNQFIAQEFSPPAEIDLTVDVQKEGQLVREVQKMKYDLRCYTYQEKLQLIIARVYQGQTTNLRTEGGGFAIVKKEI